MSSVAESKGFLIYNTNNFDLETLSENFKYKVLRGSLLKNVVSSLKQMNEQDSMRQAFPTAGPLIDEVRNHTYSFKGSRHSIQGSPRTCNLTYQGKTIMTIQIEPAACIIL